MFDVSGAGLVAVTSVQVCMSWRESKWENAKALGDPKLDCLLDPTRSKATIYNRGHALIFHSMSVRHLPTRRDASCLGVNRTKVLKSCSPIKLHSGELYTFAWPEIFPLSNLDDFVLAARVGAAPRLCQEHEFTFSAVATPIHIN